MPVENSNAEWPEDESPYQPVAHLTFPVQDAYSSAWGAFVEDSLFFCPAHSLAATARSVPSCGPASKPECSGRCAANRTGLL